MLIFGRKVAKCWCFHGTSTQCKLCLCHTICLELMLQYLMNVNRFILDLLSFFSHGKTPDRWIYLFSSFLCHIDCLMNAWCQLCLIFLYIWLCLRATSNKIQSHHATFISFLGSGPGGDASHIEQGWSVCPSLCPSICSSIFLPS